MRPALKPALARVWRDETLFSSAGSRIVRSLLHGLDAADRALLTSLDGSRRRDPFTGRCRSSSRCRLLTRLERAGALDDAPAGDCQVIGSARTRPASRSRVAVAAAPGAGAAACGARADRRVEIVAAAASAPNCGTAGRRRASVWSDRGRAAGQRAADIAPGGVRREDAGRGPGEVAAAAAAARAPPARRPGSAAPAGSPGLAGARRRPLDRLAPDEGAAAEVGNVPLLVTGVRETTGVVGPLVLPGRTGCLRCQHLHRCDRDPAWPRSRRPAGRSLRHRAPPCDVALAALIAALTGEHCRRSGNHGRPDCWPAESRPRG